MDSRAAWAIRVVGLVVVVFLAWAVRGLDSAVAITLGVAFAIVVALFLRRRGTGRR